MNLEKYVLLIVCTPLVACDLLDMEDGMTSAADTGTEDPDAEETGTEDPGPDDPADETGGGDPDADESTGGDDVDPSAGGNPDVIPENLVKSWYTGNGETHLETLDLFTDWTYQEERKGQGDVDGCWTAYTYQLSGEYGVVGDVLTLHATSAHLFVDECGTVQTFDDLPPDAVFDFALGADEWGYTLTLWPEDGSSPIEYHAL